MHTSKSLGPLQNLACEISLFALIAISRRFFSAARSASKSSAHIDDSNFWSSVGWIGAAPRWPCGVAALLRAWRPRPATGEVVAEPRLYLPPDSTLYRLYPRSEVVENFGPPGSASPCTQQAAPPRLQGTAKSDRTPRDFVGPCQCALQSFWAFAAILESSSFVSRSSHQAKRAGGTGRKRVLLWSRLHLPLQHLAIVPESRYFGGLRSSRLLMTCH